MSVSPRPLGRRITLILQAVLALVFALLFASGALGDAAFGVYLFWNVTLFVTAAFTIGNLNALALEPLGHIAGMAASVMGAIATVIGALAGAAVGALFNGTPVPLLCAMAVLMTIGAVIMLRMPRERATQA